MNKRCCGILMFLFLSLIFGAQRVCEGTQVQLPESVLIKGVEHVQQRSDFCGEACAEMYLKKLGFGYTQDDVFNCSGLDAIKARGCYTAELKAALDSIGFITGEVWSYVDANDADRQMQKHFQAICDDLQKGIATIVCMYYDEEQNSPEHFRLILGYGAKTDSVIYHEPAELNGSYRKMPRKTFFKLWGLKFAQEVIGNRPKPVNRAISTVRSSRNNSSVNQKLLLIRIPLKVGKIKPPQKTKGYTNADYAQHVMKLKTRIPDGTFSMTIARPFVVIGNEAPSMVKRRAEKTVQWAVDKLKAEYFENDPCGIIDIWLFKNDSTYLKYAKEIFGDEPTTPFGYFSDSDNALIMNIATGGGTLVHEIVHPFIAANFPECPAWFNEGLASLYEQCEEKGGRIWGLTNWRLAGLQEKTRSGKLPSFDYLIKTSSSEFYGGTAYSDNYAQARYLCYYLQAKGLLRKFYHEFHNNCKQDGAGYDTLKKILAIEDMKKFEKDWRNWGLQLTFP